MILQDVLARARALADGAPEEVAQRLRASVIRPLAGAGDGGSAPAEDDLWALARDATELRAQGGASPELIEATAALQSLVPDRAAELAELQAHLPEGIEVAPDGPYLATNVTTLRSWLGAPLPALPQMALCRCGASAIKPLCDGSHAEVGFSGAKDPDRVPDRRDTYFGQATIYDNRGTCAHSGFCTDRVPTAFRVDQEPFVAPSGGRIDEIARAVRACPSGALAIALAAREDERADTDTERPPEIEVSKDGPYRITGGIPLTEPGGAPVPRNEGASLEHYSLCRCGHSLNKPFCSGQHWRIGFRDPELSEEPTVFEWAGGLPALTRMTRIFYERYVPEDPLLAPLFANMAPDHPERVASWLSETFGGPKFYSERYGGYERMLSQHLGKHLSEEQRARWIQLITRAADDAKLPADPEFRAAFVSYLEWGSRIALENSQPGAHPPQHMPVPRWWWVCDATPGSRVSALAPPEEAPAPDPPGPGEALSFEQHIKPLFRRRDRDSMRFAFDLWSRDDVAEHADAILERLTAGTMPCDGAWPPERVDAFRRWVEAGKAP